MIKGTSSQDLIETFCIHFLFPFHPHRLFYIEFKALFHKYLSQISHRFLERSDYQSNCLAGRSNVEQPQRHLAETKYTCNGTNKHSQWQQNTLTAVEKYTYSGRKIHLQCKNTLAMAKKYTCNVKNTLTAAEKYTCSGRKIHLQL